MATQGEAACLVLYALARPRQWQAKTPLMTETSLREILLDQRKVGELGGPGLKLRVASFAQVPWDADVWETATERMFETTQIPTITLTQLLSGNPVPRHLQIDGGDFRLIRPTPA